MTKQPPAETETNRLEQMKKRTRPRDVALSLGGNLGDVADNFQQAARKLAQNGLQNIRASKIYLTKPVNCPPGTPHFLNAAVTGKWSGSPEQLLELCARIETQAGRQPTKDKNQNRPLDIDIILFDDLNTSTPQLQIPHPRADQRRFVLQPLAEINPHIIFPNSGNSAAQLLETLNKKQPPTRNVRPIKPFPPLNCQP